jgi:DNA polymerase-4
MVDDFPAICRDCASEFPVPTVERRCPRCDSMRLVENRELRTLAIAHLDCDAFYATVEKRDNPELEGKPVAVGGATRGVVLAACYVARRYGIRSAMPMRKAIERCPHLMIVKPDMRKYREVGREVRSLMNEVTPKVEPISVDEAFLDLTGTGPVHGTYPARVLVDLVRRIERDIGITASVGLSYNKFLAKVASELDKPRGFSILGRNDAVPFLTDKPVSLLWGVGPSFEKRLNRDGIFRIGQIRDIPEKELVKRYGAIGSRLARFAIGQDHRAVHSGDLQKSISAETTFDTDLARPDDLLARLWPLCEKVGRQLKDKDLAASSVVLKLKTADFRIVTRSRKLARPTQYGADLFAIARPVLEREANGRRFRLIGIGTKDLVDGVEAAHADLFGPTPSHVLEGAMDQVRGRFGDDAIRKGRSLRR